MTESGWIHATRLIARGLCLIVLLLCLTISIGWIFNLTSLTLSYICLSTALLLLFGSIGTLCATIENPPIAFRAVTFLAGLAVVIASFSYSLHHSFFCAPTTPWPTPLELPYGNGIASLLLGFGLMLTPLPKMLWTAQAALSALLFLPIFGFINYFFLAAVAPGATEHNRLSLLISLCFAALSLSLLFSNPYRGIASLFLLKGLGGTLTRRIVPFAFSAPFLLGLMAYFGYQHHFYSLHVAIALFALALIALAAIFLSLATAIITNIEGARQQLEIEEQKLSTIFQTTTAIASSQGTEPHALFEILPLGVYIEADDQIVYANHTFRGWVGIIGGPFSLVDCVQQADERDKLKSFLLPLRMGQKQSDHIELTMERADGRPFDVALFGTACLYKARPALLVFLQDISDRKLTEVNLQAALEEKEALLREVHHRVKNNLQVITSLLHLQIHNLKDSKQIATLQDSVGRVKAIALMHDNLYRAKNLATFRFSDYIEGIVSYLKETYAVDRNRIAVRTNIADISIHPDVAIPCGLIVNELLSNALKYAFPEDNSGEIAITGIADGKRYHLIVKDNGIGLPADLNIEESRTLGLHLVALMATQLQGTYQIRREQGTTVEIDFPLIKD